ncbi:hypothetical protein GCM10009785_11780 [Brooklawnia cerclae]
MHPNACRPFDKLKGRQPKRSLPFDKLKGRQPKRSLPFDRLRTRPVETSSDCHPVQSEAQAPVETGSA